VAFYPRTAIVAQAGQFYTVRWKHARGFAERAIFLTGPAAKSTGRFAGQCPGGWIMCLMTGSCRAVRLRARINAALARVSHVFAGGIATVACPYAFDQPNNANAFAGPRRGHFFLPPAETEGGRFCWRRCREAGRDPILSLARTAGQRSRQENGRRKRVKFLETNIREKKRGQKSWPLP